MSSSITPVDGVSTAPPVASRQTRPSGKASEEEVRPEAAVQKEPANREDVLTALRNVGDKLSFGGRVAEFSFDEKADRVVVKVYSQASEPRQVVRSIPPAEYLAFVAKYRELIGVLFDEKV